MSLIHAALRWYSVPLALVAWEALSHSGLVHPLLVPPLETIAKALVDGVANGDLLYHSRITLARWALGYGMAIVAGTGIGITMTQSQRLEEMVEPIFSFGYPVPKIALYPIFLFLFGLGAIPKVSLVFLECLYPIAVNTYLGVKATERLHIWAARTMGANARQIFWRLFIPSAAPYILTGVRIGAHVGLATIVILEMIGDNRGLGYYIDYASASFEFARSFAGLATVVFWGFIIDRLLILLRDKIVFWEPRANDG